DLRRPRRHEPGRPAPARRAQRPGAGVSSARRRDPARRAAPEAAARAQVPSGSAIALRRVTRGGIRWPRATGTVHDHACSFVFAPVVVAPCAVELYRVRDRSEPGLWSRLAWAPGF